MLHTMSSTVPKKNNWIHVRARAEWSRTNRNQRTIPIIYQVETSQRDTGISINCIITHCVQFVLRLARVCSWIMLSCAEGIMEISTLKCCHLRYAWHHEHYISRFLPLFCTLYRSRPCWMQSGLHPFFSPIRSYSKEKVTKAEKI